MNRRRRPARSLLLALLLALAAAGCSGSATPRPPAPPPHPRPPPPPRRPPGPGRAQHDGGASAGAVPLPGGRLPGHLRPATSGYPAADMFTGRGCAFVAPVAGRVDEVTRTDPWRPASDRGADRGGRSVSLVGVDGVRYYGSHLEAVAPGIAPGVTVRAGRLLGRIGNSGSASITPVHLHFGISWPTRPGIWWVRRGDGPARSATWTPGATAATCPRSGRSGRPGRRPAARSPRARPAAEPGRGQAGRSAGPVAVRRRPRRWRGG